MRTRIVRLPQPAAAVAVAPITASVGREVGATGGLTGLVIDAVSALGELGVALLILIETVVPPIPSEVVLPFSGALVADGRFTFIGLLAAATSGSLLGAVLLYELGRRIGADRTMRALARLPLVRRDDVERGERWFARHGGTAVLTGRLLPGIRSLVSIPAGAEAMPRGRFLLLTTLGSAVWNAVLLGGGVWLGESWEQVGRYTEYLDVAMLAAVVVGVGLLLRRRLRETET